MGLPLLYGTLTVFGLLFSLAVFRADRTRWDNRLFAAMALLDTIENGYRAVRLLGGFSLAENAAIYVCSLLAFPMGVLTVEFAYSFPFNRRAPRFIRLPVVAATAFMFGLVMVPGFRESHVGWQAILYSPTLFIVSVLLLGRNIRAVQRAKGDTTSVVLVAAAIALRWLSAIATYGVSPLISPNAFPSFVLFDGTVVTVLCYLLITFAFMRSQLFSLRGFATELLILSAGSTGIIALSALAVEAALRTATGPGALRAALVFATFIPVAAVVASARFGRRFQRVVTRNLDPRRLLREDVLERAEASRDPDPAALVRIVEAALAELAAGTATYLGTAGKAPLPKALAERLAVKDTDHVRGRSEDVPHDLVVAVRSTAALHGALAISGERIDRETLLAATHLAARLALKLDAYTLFRELEGARRLATLGSFAAAIAHDIRTPLTSVQMNVQILRRKVSLPPDDMEYFDIALEELRRLNTNISELLDFAKPAQVDSSPIDLSAVIADARRATESVLAERGLSLDVQRAADTPVVLGDAARLRNVLENLVTNAANVSKDGATIAIRTRRAEDGRAVLEVADHGPGIAPADLPRIFEPFFTTRPDGTGLGLAICDKLVRAQNGEIRVDSAPGNGATFAVLLPSAPASLPIPLPGE